MLQRFNVPPLKPSVFRVLVIDGPAPHRDLTAATLAQAWPFRQQLVVDWARDASEALEKLRATRFTLILFDCGSPTVAAADILRAVRAAGSRVPSLVISECDSASEAARLEPLGGVLLARDHVTPVSFYDAVAQALRLLGLMPADTQPIRG